MKNTSIGTHAHCLTCTMEFYAYLGVVDKKPFCSCSFTITVRKTVLTMVAPSNWTMHAGADTQCMHVTRYEERLHGSKQLLSAPDH